MKKFININLINNIVKFISINTFAIIFLLMIFIDTKTQYKYANNLKIENIKILGIIFLIFLGLKLIKKILSKFNIENIIQKILSKSNLIIGTIFVILIIIQIIILKNVYFETTWDVEHMMDTAINFGKTGVFENNEYYDKYQYFSVYPNNLFLAKIFSIIARILNNFNKIDYTYKICDLIGIILVDLSGIIMVKTIANITENKIYKIIGAIVFFCFIGLSPWFLVPYSDTYSIIFPIFILYNYTKQNKKIYNYILIGLFSYIGYLIKPTTVIVVIAISIVELYKIFIKLINKKNIELVKIIYIILGIIIAILLNFGLNRIVTYNVNKQTSLTMYHYLMMGLNPETIGTYSSEDVLNSLKIYKFEKRISFNKHKIRERANLLDFKKFREFYTKKILINYNDGTFAWGREGGFFEKENDIDNNLAKKLKSFYYLNGDSYKIFVSIMQTIWLTLILFTLIKAIFEKFTYKDSVMYLSIIGLTIFTLLFEARARYLYTYSTFYIILAVTIIKFPVSCKSKI